MDRLEPVLDRHLLGLHVGADVDALGTQLLLEGPGQVGLVAGTDAGLALQLGDGDAEAGAGLGQLGGDGPAPDEHDALGGVSMSQKVSLVR